MRISHLVKSAKAAVNSRLDRLRKQPPIHAHLVAHVVDLLLHRLFIHFGRLRFDFDFQKNFLFKSFNSSKRSKSFQALQILRILKILNE